MPGIPTVQTTKATTKLAPIASSTNPLSIALTFLKPSDYSDK